jgi:DNA-binding MarR family transcriptional regulator
LSAPKEGDVARVVATYDRLHRLLAPAHASDVVDIDLTIAQLKALYVIAATGPIRMGQLAVRLGIALSTTTGVVDGLVQLAMVERLEDPSDRRQVLVRATEDATRRLDAINELGRERLHRLLSSMETADDLALVERAIDLLTDAVARSLATENASEGYE